MNWDTIVSTTILLWIGLAFWARITHQTIPDIIKGITEAISDKGEEGVEYTEEVFSYD